MNKEAVLNVLKTLNDEFDIEVLIEKLLFVNEVERGLKDVRDGKTIPVEVAKQRLGIK